MNKVELVQKGYQYFSEGKITAVLELFHPDIIWEECQGFPFIEGEGVFRGQRAIVQGVFSQWRKYYDGFSIDIQELFGNGDKVVMVGHYLGVYKTTGKHFNANAIHVWTIKDGKLSHFFQAVDTAEIINP